MGPTDYLVQAAQMDRAAFATACPFLFLYGKAPLEPPQAPSPTTNLVFDDNQQTFTSRGLMARTPDIPAEPILVAFAVRKRTGIFPSMITVGRTRNQDIVIAHVSVSKFHAIFRTRYEGTAEQLDLADAGSRNGTWVNDRRIPSRGAAVPVRRDDLVRFADIVLTVFDAEAVWDAVHSSSNDESRAR